MDRIPVALPPLAEQRRIVARVDEIMGLCDRFEEAQKEREAKRQLLTAASVHHLNQSADDEAFRRRASFYIAHQRRFTSRLDQIPELRRNVLSLAVRGRLSFQDPNEEPAAELVRKIETTRINLYSAKMIPKPKPLPDIKKLDVPFSLPSGWEWVMLGTLCYQVADGPHFSPQYVAPAVGVPFLSTRNVRTDRFDLSDLKYVSKEDHALFCHRIKPLPGDVLYTKGGTTGIARVNDLNFEFSVWVHVAVLRIAKDFLSPHYVALALNSPLCYEQSQKYTQGISNFDLGLTRMIKILMPLPPAAEQQRIVSKVDELMAVCDDLQQQLEESERCSSALLQSVLHHALHTDSFGERLSDETISQLSAEA